MIAIAYRLSTVQQGRIVERGTHETLLQQSGVYRRLYLAQFASEAEQISAGTPHERGSIRAWFDALISVVTGAPPERRHNMTGEHQACSLAG